MRYFDSIDMEKAPIDKLADGEGASAEKGVSASTPLRREYELPYRRRSVSTRHNGERKDG